MRASTLARLAAGLVPFLTAGALTGTALSAPRAGIERAETRWAAAEPVKLRPGALPRGENTRVPFVIRVPEVTDGRLLHGDLELEVPPQSRLLGMSGSDYLLGVHDADYRQVSVVRLHPDGTTETVVPMQSRSLELALSDDGSRVVLYRTRGRYPHFTTPVSVYDTATGARTARRVFDTAVGVLDVRGNRILLSSFTSLKSWTKMWNHVTDHRRTVIGQPGYRADIRADLLATYSGDPYQDGCSVLRRLSAPRTVLMRSCDERVEAIAPDGRRVATVHILSDGLGHGEVSVRTTGGRLEARYPAVRNGYLNSVLFERNRALLVEAYGPSRGALVRCVDSRCERASDLWPRPEL